MSDSLLLTKLYVPSPRPNLVPRSRLIERLNEGLSLSRKLTLISAPAGFGKTTLVSEWIAGPWKPPAGQVCGMPVAWLSLDEGDNDPARFISYLIAALQTIMPGIGETLLSTLKSPQPLHIETILTSLLNEISNIPGQFVLILDDYHAIDSHPVDQTLDFLVEHQPPQMHMVIATREDPQLHLARYRARGQLTELRAADLRFTPIEAAEFLNKVTGLDLSGENIAALETRTEGWIAGLQLAAISMQGHKDATGFIQSFTGSHRFVMDYLLEEVLHQQSESIQLFLLRTSILDRMCGPLCDAVLFDSSVSGQATLEYLEHANLFIVPLDNERRWYRYHHLFAELLRQRLHQSAAARNDEKGVAELHIRASQWYEDNSLILEAFRHAAAAKDIDRAERLMESKEMPIHQRGAATAILSWLESLPTSLLDAKPSLSWKQASLMLVIGHTIGVEEKLQATEAALAATTLPGAELDVATRNLIGKIAVARANLAQTQALTETILEQANRALEYLHPNNLSYRSSATRVLGFAYYLQGDRGAATRAYTEALALAQQTGDITNDLLASIRLGQLQVLDNHLTLAAETFKRILPLIVEYSPPNASVAYNGMAWICYEWNDLSAAEQYGELGLQMAKRYNQVIDRVIKCELFLAYLKLAQGDAVGAENYLAQAEHSILQKNHTFRLPEIVAARAFMHFQRGNIDAAAELVQQNDLPHLQARICIARGDPTAALAILVPLRKQFEEANVADGWLSILVLETIALHQKGEKDQALKMLKKALTLAEPEGFIRLYVDRGEPMRLLLLDFKLWIEKQSADSNHPLRKYSEKILAAFTPFEPVLGSKTSNSQSEMIEPLSQRELEVLQLICQGLSNNEICDRLFLALDTVKGHNRRIFEKLQVHRRTEAIARARELNLF